MNQNTVSDLQNLPVAMPTSELASLEPRKVEELSFHDAWRVEGGTGADAANNRWYQATGPLRRYIIDWFKRRVAGGVFLDYACGGGGWCFFAAEIGARFALGIDISLVSVQNANSAALSMGHGPDKVRFLQRDCEATHLPDNTFKTVLCSGMLHHLDLNRAFPELHRIVEPGGRVLCIEPLAYNPAIQMYRKRTPELRTEWEAEHILTRADLQRAREAGFRVENVRHWFLLSPLGAALPSGWLRRSAIALLHLVEWPLSRIPGLKWWSWQMTFELVKPA
jgi:SAM-dependent methyltransferase